MSEDKSTLTFDTVQGKNNYGDLNDMLATPYRTLIDNVIDGQYDNSPVDAGLLKEFHRDFVVNLMPGIAGVWRTEPVQVGHHTPLPPWEIEYKMKEAVDNLVWRMNNSENNITLQVESLAYAECSFFSIHPFKDFNGRSIRLF